MHCVQRSFGAKFHEKCPLFEGEKVVSKGRLERVDSYSAFGTPPETTSMLDELKLDGITELYCVGLAYDYTVGLTAIDGAKLGFKTYVLTDATRAVAEETEETMSQRLEDAGVI